MRLNSKLTWGAAWAGLAVVLAVPSADFLTRAVGGGQQSAVLTSNVEAATPPRAAAATDKSALPAPTKTATVTTTKTPNGVIITPAGSTPPANAVDKFIDSGKSLPDYISDTGSATSTTPAPAKANTETQVASIDPTPVAPTPFPAWARPSWTPAPAAPVVTAPVAATPVEPVVIVDDQTLTGSVTPTGPVPPTPIVDDSANWENESLRQYLERRGILEGSGTQSSATVTQRSTGSSYDPNGFYLDQGPNAVDDRELRRQRVLEMLEAQDPNSFTLF